MTTTWWPIFGSTCILNHFIW